MLMEFKGTAVSLARFEPVIDAKINSGFFQSDGDWTTYRRNYFKVVCGLRFKTKLNVPCRVAFENIGEKVVTDFILRISARTLNGLREVVLIQHTTKRDKGPQSTPEPSSCTPTTSIFDPQKSISFERLQFKTATANNGKRKAAQQYHIILVEALALLSDGNYVLVATTESPPLVVRGRSPGHYTKPYNNNTSLSNTKQDTKNNNSNNNNNNSDKNGNINQYNNNNTNGFKLVVERNDEYSTSTTSDIIDHHIALPESAIATSRILNNVQREKTLHSGYSNNDGQSRQGDDDDDVDGVGVQVDYNNIWSLDSDNNNNTRLAPSIISQVIIPNNQSKNENGSTSFYFSTSSTNNSSSLSGEGGDTETSNIVVEKNGDDDDDDDDGFNTFESSGSWETVYRSSDGYNNN